MLRAALRGPTVLAALGVPALTLFACVQPPAMVIETTTGDVVALESWTATLTAPSGETRGRATLAPGVTYRETQATVTLSGATPRAAHAWYVQLGECGHDRGILVGPQAYRPVVIDDQGEGRSTVTLPFTVPTNGQFFVTVRRSESEASPVIACGNLTKDGPLGGSTVAEARAP
jgi:hypothetical protein